MRRLFRPLMFGFLALTTLFAAAYFFRAAGLIPQTIPLDPNEGWNAYHTMAALGHGALYPPSDSYLTNNYPPLSYYVAGLVSLLTGDTIVAGRIVALAAFLLLCAGIYRASRYMGATAFAAACALLFFITGMLAFTDYVAMDDPQMLAHAIATGGFLLVLRGKNITAAALFFTIAFFVKHNIIAMAMASALWLLWKDKRAAAQFIFAGIGFTALGLYLFELMYGLPMWRILASARSYSLSLLSEGLGAWLIWYGFAAVAALALIFRQYKDPYVQLGALYALCALVPGIYFLGGAGVDVNAMFDADIALTLLSALFISRLNVARPLAVICLSLPALFGSIQMARAWHFTPADILHPGHKEIGLAKSDIQFIRARPGPAMCEMLSLCYWAGKPPEVDMFNTGEQFATGARSPTDLAARIAHHHYAVIQFDPGQRKALGPVVLAALEKYYHLEHADGFGEFYIPAVLGS